MTDQPQKRRKWRRWVVAAVLGVAVFAGWAFRTTASFDSRSRRLQIGQTPDEVLRIMGEPDVGNFPVHAMYRNPQFRARLHAADWWFRLTGRPVMVQDSQEDSTSVTFFDGRVVAIRRGSEVIDEPIPASPVAADDAKRLTFDFGDQGTLRLEGVTPDPDGPGIVWKVPGFARLSLSMPWEGEIPESVRVSLECVPVGSSRSTYLTSVMVTPAAEGDRLQIVHEVGVYAAMTPTGPTRVVVKRYVDKKWAEITSMPVPIRFVKR